MCIDHLILLHLQLVPEVKRVDFSLLEKRINFREKGDTPNSFEIIQWKWDQSSNPFQKIASYSTKNQKLLFITQNISWHTPNNTASSLHPLSHMWERHGTT